MSEAIREAVKAEIEGLLGKVSAAEDCIREDRELIRTCRSEIKKHERWIAKLAKP